MGCNSGQIHSHHPAAGHASLGSPRRRSRSPYPSAVCVVAGKAAQPVRALVPKVPGLARAGVGNGLDQMDFANSEQSDGLTLVYMQVLAGNTADETV